MTTQTVQDFLSNIDTSGGLTPEQAAALLELPQEGDTVTSTETADAPASAPAPAPSPAAEAEPNATTKAEPTAEDLSAENAAILAKDGKHLIPFDKLTEARTEAQRAAAERDAALARAAELEAQLAAGKQPAAQAPQEKQPEAVDLRALREQKLQALATGDDARALELEEQIDAEVQRVAEDRAYQRFEQKRQQEQAQAAEQAMQQVAADAKTRFPALDPSSAQASAGAIAFVVAERDSLIAKGEPAHKALEQAVNKAAGMFGWSNGQKPAPDAKAAEAAAAAAIAAAKAPTPATLSDIPGGKPAGPSLEAQLATKSGAELVEIMSTWSAEQRDEYLNRAI